MFFWCVHTYGDPRPQSTFLFYFLRKEHKWPRNHWLDEAVWALSPRELLFHTSSVLVSETYTTMSGSLYMGSGDVTGVSLALKNTKKKHFSELWVESMHSFLSIGQMKTMKSCSVYHILGGERILKRLGIREEMLEEKQAWNLPILHFPREGWV